VVGATTARSKKKKKKILITIQIILLISRSFTYLLVSPTCFSFFHSLEMSKKSGASKKVPAGTMIDATVFLEGLEEVLSQASNARPIPTVPATPVPTVISAGTQSPAPTAEGPVPVGVQTPVATGASLKGSAKGSAKGSPAVKTPLPRPVIRATRSSLDNDEDDDNVSQLSNNSMGSQSYANATYHCFHCTTEGGRYRAFRSYSTWSQHMIKRHKAKCSWDEYAQRYAPRSEEEVITQFGNLDDGLDYEDV
jgi:hypothetical protein